MTKTELSSPIETSLLLVAIGRAIAGRQILDGINLKVGPGELLVLLGPSGSGKTSLLRIIAGLDRADRGRIEVGGRRIDHLLPYFRQVGLVFQEHALFEKMTVEQNIAFGPSVRKLPRRRIQQVVVEMLHLVRLEEQRQRYPFQLSVGQKQRVAVARTLACRPKVLLLDEPLAALGSEMRSKLRRKLHRWVRSTGTPTLFVTKDPDEALELGDRIAVLNHGRLEQVDSPFLVYNHPKNEFVAKFLGATNVFIARWASGKVMFGSLRLPTPEEGLSVQEGQLVQVVFRPEDVVLSFQPQFLKSASYLGRGTVEEAWYVGPSERLVVSLQRPVANQAGPVFVDETFAVELPVTVSRSKWEAEEMQLSKGDQVAVGLKSFRLRPYYPVTLDEGSEQPTST